MAAIDDFETTHLVGTSDRKMMRVLVVDNNADMREDVCRLLAGRYEVLTADNGEDGLRSALADLPDLIIADTTMSTRDGVELLQRIRSGTSTIPVILLSARGRRCPQRRHGRGSG